MNFYSVYDKKANIYNTPFHAPTDVHAMRTFAMQVNDANKANMLHFAPDDFTLYRLGTFDDHTGEFTSETPQVLVEAAYVLKNNKENN